MRIRTVKPEFWRSEDVTCLPVFDRLLFLGLWAYVDDNGVGSDEPALIAADLFARDLSGDAPETLRKVSEGLRRLSDVGLIVRYDASANAYASGSQRTRRLFYVTGWLHQKISHPAPARKPLPNGEIRYPTAQDNFAALARTATPEPLWSDSGAAPEEIRSRSALNRDQVTGFREQVEDHSASADAERDATTQRWEQQRRENTKRRDKALYDEFDAWWAEYPRKRDKGHAMKAYKAARRKASAEELLSGLRAHLPEFQARPPDRVPYPATWLNGECWNDQPQQQQRAPTSRVSQHMDLARRLADRQENR